MAIPPELEIRQYAARHHLNITRLSRSATLMVVTCKEEKGLDEMVKHFSKRSGIDVDKYIQSVVFLKREVPNVQTKE